MTTINDAPSSPPLQPVTSAQAKANATAADVTNTATQTVSTATTSEAASASSASISSSVTNLSTISTQLQAAQATSTSDAVFSTSKVNEIKQAISEGRFQVNSANVAAKLLDSVHELLGSRQRN